MSGRRARLAWLLVLIGALGWTLLVIGWGDLVASLLR